MNQIHQINPSKNLINQLNGLKKLAIAQLVINVIILLVVILTLAIVPTILVNASGDIGASAAGIAAGSLALVFIIVGLGIALLVIDILCITKSSSYNTEARTNNSLVLFAVLGFFLSFIASALLLHEISKEMRLQNDILDNPPLEEGPLA